MTNASFINSHCILEFDGEEAKRFFLKSESYCNVGLPKYIDFSLILESTSSVLTGRQLNSMGGKLARDFEGVNYLLLSNKDGKFAWRPFELIHPAIYVALVNELTEADNWDLVLSRFEQLHSNEKISCLSMPVESSDEEQQDIATQINNWWHSVEQRSIELALEFDYLYETDITDCYGSIYTHSIPWALHDKEWIKEPQNRNDKSILGNKIDTLICSMRYAQTNGIPQGSVLMDFIAEMVLGYADYLISQKLEEDAQTLDYQILRYRDDFRIFVNSPPTGELILKTISEVMASLGLKMNPTKTTSTNEVIRNSIKADKVAWLKSLKKASSLQKRLFLIHDHAMSYPNAGSLVSALVSFYSILEKVENLQEASIKPMISIATNIALHNPRTLSACSAILSYLIDCLETYEAKAAIIEVIQKKFERVPNTGFLDIWLQRVTLPFEPDKDYEEKLCKLVKGDSVHLWNSDWIRSTELQSAIASTQVVNQSMIDALPEVMSANEISLFQHVWVS